MSSPTAAVKTETETIPQLDPDGETPSLDESDDLFVSEDDEDIPGPGIYSEASEQLPKSAAYDADLNQVPADIRDILNGAIEALKGCDSQHPRYKVIFDRIQELMSDPTAPKRKINIVGNSGAGKSSLVNSLLGCLEAARALSGSKACTQVPTSYQSPFPGQVRPYAARVELFAIDETSKKFDLMLRDYNLLHSDENKDWPTDELAKIKSDATTAFEAFRTLFCQQDEFSSDEAGHYFLKEASEVSRSVTVDKFTSWCKQLQAKYFPQSQDPSFFFESDDQQDLIDYLEPFAFSSSMHKAPAMWPLVRMIHQGLRVEILQHANIVDWPGSGDTNSLRANASSDRIFDCDEIWIVSDVARIITEPSVKMNLLRYSNTIECVLICTCIDRDLEEGLAAEFRRHGYGTQDYDSLRVEENRLEKSISASENKIQIYENALRTGGNKRQKISEKGKAGVMIKKANLEDALEDEKEQLQEISQRCFESLLLARKNYIAGEFEKATRDDNLQGGKLRLHFIANTHYTAHKRGKKLNGPHLSPEATGIPALRAHILEAAAPRIMSVLQNHLDHKVTVFLNGVDLLISPADLRGCEDALNMVSAKQTRVRPFLTGYRELVEAGVEESLVAVLKDKQQDFVDAASEHLEEKKKWSYSSIGAFVRKDGCHTTKAVGYRSWTDEFLEGATEEILTRWPGIVIDEEEAFRCLKAKLIAECNSISEQMKDDAAGFILPMDRFAEFINGHIKGLEQLCEAYRTGIARDLVMIRIEATQADEQCPTGYFKLAMQEAWDTCKEFTGAGTKAKIMTTLENYLKLKAERSPFAMLADAIKSQIMADLADQLQDLMEGVEHILQDIRNWLEAMFHEEVQDPEEVEIRRRLKKYVERALPKLAIIKGTVKMIEQRYEVDEEE